MEREKMVKVLNEPGMARALIKAVGYDSEDLTRWFARQAGRRAGDSGARLVAAPPVLGEGS